MSIERVLVVEDERLNRESLAAILESQGLEVVVAASGEEGVASLDREDVDLVITDLKLGAVSGLEVLRAVRSRSEHLPVVLVTAYGTIESAVEAMRLGAEDYLLKPFSVEQIELLLERTRKSRRLLSENTYLKEALAPPEGENLVGQSPRFRERLETARRVAPTKATVLILGESGTGKELFAHLIHRESPRRSRAFVRVNCAALSPSLLESELFGHERGAFTGAVRRREGRFELADGGTLLFDEVGELPLELQPKLLRVLEQEEFERVGGSRTLRVDVRVIAATNRDLKREVERGRFRADLYYRLAVYPIELPPLRERRGDIEGLARHFLNRYQKLYLGQVGTIEDAAIERLVQYPWPGNVRELENVMQRVAIRITDPLLRAKDLDADLPKEAMVAKCESGLEPLVGRSIAHLERELILKTLERTGDNKTEAARLLGVTARTLRNKLKVYGNA